MCSHDLRVWSFACLSTPYRQMRASPFGWSRPRPSPDHYSQVFSNQPLTAGNVTEQMTTQLTLDSTDSKHAAGRHKQQIQSAANRRVPKPDYGEGAGKVFTQYYL